MRLRTCPRCGEASSGFMKLCGRCEQTTTIQTEPKAPKTPHIEPEGDE